MTSRDDHPTGGYSRRRFLGVLGAGAATAVAAGPAAVPGVAAAAKGATAQPVPPPGRFGRLFRLPPFAEPSDAVTAALQEIGRAGGLMDAQDALDRGPKDLIVDPALSANNPNNPTHTAGTTFMGQFMDHDMTFDATSRLGKPTKPEATANARTPGFDLDPVYGGGPVADPQLYDPNDRIKLKVEYSDLFEDVPRTADGQAIIGDPRNDSNLIVAGLHAAVLLFHNHAVDVVRQEGKLDDVSDVFAAARQLTTWHYQWLILHEFLPLFVGKRMANDLLAHGPRLFKPERGKAFIPVEFSGAAYRFGHSMVRPSYRANLQGNGGEPFFGLIFDPAQEGAADPEDLRGGTRAARRFIGWQTFFDFGDGEVKPNKRIDTTLSTPLFDLPLGAIASHDAPTALPQRTLLRHLTWSLPSGQDIAGQLGVAPLDPNDLQDLASFGLGFELSTPLWYYVLREADLVADGLHLGPVGGRIVGDVIVGLLRADPASYLAAAPDWKPTLPTRAGGSDFRMVDFLTFAGVDPGTRGQ